MAKAQGSNELNLLLKSKVVKIKVELDIKGSGLAGQVNKITDFLKDKRVKLKVELQTTGLSAEVQKLNTNLKDKKVKIGVQLSYNKTDINKQIKEINTLIKSNSGISNIKVAMNIDVKGSASKIKTQLAEVNKEILEFNKNYKKMLEDTKKISNGFGDGASGKKTSPIASQDSYAKSLLQAKQYMGQQYGKGLFTSTEMKDANGVLTGFIGTLTKANGVVQKIRYDWDANSASFTPINRTTVTNTEKNVASAMKSLRQLDSEIMTLGKSQNKFWQESQALKTSGDKGMLTQSAVDSLRTRIKEEQKLQSQIKEENNLLRQQKELIAEINRAQKSAKSSNVKNELGNLKTSVNAVSLDDSMAKNQLNDLKSSLNSLKQSYADNVKREKELKNATEKRKDVLAEIARIEKSKSLTGSGATSKRYIDETKALANNIKTMEQYNKVRERMSATNRGFKSQKIDDDIDKQLAKLQKSMFAYAQQTGKSLSVIETRYQQVAQAVKNNLASATKEVEKFNRLTESDKVKKAYQQRQNSIVTLNSDADKNKQEHAKVNNLVNTKDNQALKEYIANLNGAQVATMRLITDSKGITRITTQFASTKKTAKEVVYEIDQVDKKLRQISTADVFNANRNLGMFEQLKVAMARVPVWTVAMTAFYGSIRTVKNMTEEILKLDKAMTELRRVADSQIDTGFLFEGALKLSKELGNNIHDVMASVNDLARTFGDFNERQLLAITHTATLMSNVSDLSAQEATESLVGTMNAFNITAEDSIRIVDSMNEVDNNYAISTKQLATGLAKSASTSKTFGVSLEENLGHITAIGAVTMESGNIIGNSLKTIYSRITTMDGVADVFENLNISMRDSTGDMRDVTDILNDLSLQWHDLSKAERQNIGVKVAGRYQLSRFLALMNNYSMATDATTTALNSQGSATRENAQYLKSFEARINSLKNSFTELSVSVGEAFLSSGLSVGLNVLTSMASGITGLIDKIGILSVVFGGLGLALFKFGALKGIWTFATASVLGLWSAVTKTASGFYTMATTARASFNAVRTGAITASTAVATMGTAFKVSFGFLKSAMISTGVLAGFVALGWAIEKVTSYISKQKEASEELRITNEKQIKSFRDSGDGMQGMLKQYDDLKAKKDANIDLTQEESTELERLTNQFAEQLPMVVDYYDANGNAILQSTEAIKEQINAVAELSKEEAKLKNIRLTDNIKEQAKEYDDVAEKIKDVKAEIILLKNTKFEFGVGGAREIGDDERNEKVQKKQIELMQLEAQRRTSMSGTTKVIQEQAVAYVEANGKMVGFGDNQQKLIEKFVTYNDTLLMSAQANENFEETALSMTDMAMEVADVFTNAYDIMSKDIDTSELEELRTQLEYVSASVPEDFLKIDADKPVTSMKEITNGLKEIINVGVHIQDGSEDFEGLSARLQKTGLSADEAREMMGRLADQHGNSILKAEALKQSMDGVATSIDDTAESALSAIDPIAQLFGYESGELEGIKKHIENMEIMSQVYGDGAEDMVGYLESQSQLAKFFGVTGEEIKNNIHDYNALASALSSLKIETDEQGGSYLDLSKATSGLTEKQRGMIQAWIESGGMADIFTGKMANAEDAMGKYDEELSKSREPYKIEVDDTDIQKFTNGSINELINNRGNISKLLSNDSKVVSETINNVNTSGQKLGEVTTKVDEVKKSTEGLSESTINVGKEVSGTYTAMSTAIGTNTNSIITHHDRNIKKVQELDTTYKNANISASNLNRNLANSMDTLSRYQSRVNAIGGSANGFMMSGLTTSNGDGHVVSDSISSFSATAEGVASSMASGGEGTSGVITQSIPSFTALHNTVGAGRYSYNGTGGITSSSSTEKKVAKSSTAKTAKEKKEKAEELAELYVIDLLDRKRTKYQATLSQIEARVSGLSENTKEFRQGMSEVMRYEQAIQRVNIEDLATTEKRNKSIMKELALLSNVSKHTVKQREKYNELQQEYDSNLKSIASLKGEIESTIIELRKKTEEIFLDFVGELIANIDKGLKAITDRIDDIDFELEVLELTDPDNDIAKVDLMATKVRDLTKEQNKYVEAQARLGAELRDATKKYGANSDSVKTLVKQMEDYKESWEDVTLSILKAEKEIRDLRGAIADKLVEATKKHYETVQKGAEKTKNVEIDNAKKAHEAKMKFYDKESKRITELYDQRIKALDDEHNKETYEEDVAEKNKEISKLTEKAKTYSGDNSLEGKKMYAELNEQISEKQKELDKFIKQNRLDSLKEQLNEEKEMLLDKVNTQKELDEEAHDTFITQLEAERDAVSEHYEEITNDEKKWARIREELMKGNFTVVKELLADMGIDLEQLADGTFNTLSEGFSDYSDEVRNFVLEINSMINQINAMTGSAYGKTSNISATQSVSLGEPIRNSSVTPLIQKAYAGEDLMSPTSDKNQLYDMIKDSGISEYRMNEIWRKAQAGITLDIPSPEHMQFYNMFEDIIKANKLKKFDTGGYTGNNVPKSGALAILDNKELVLNDSQTSHILDAVKLLDKVKSIMPSISRSSMEDKFATASGFTNNNNYDLTVNIDNLNGDKTGATLVVKEIMKGLKKLGR